MTQLVVACRLGDSRKFFAFLKQRAKLAFKCVRTRCQSSACFERRIVANCTFFESLLDLKGRDRNSSGSPLLLMPAIVAVALASLSSSASIFIAMLWGTLVLEECECELLVDGSDELDEIKCFELDELFDESEELFAK